jgi:hypothetical protein
MVMMLKDKKQPIVLQALNFAKHIEVVDHLWSFLDLEHKANFAEYCKNPKNPIYKNIYKSFASLKKQRKSQKSISQMSAEVTRLFEQTPKATTASAPAAALTPAEQAKLKTKQDAQKRRKDKKRVIAQELAAQEALKLKQKKEKEEAEALLSEKQRKEKERDTQLLAQAVAFEKAHEPAHRTTLLKCTLNQWQKRFNTQKKNELAAHQFAKKLDARQTNHRLSKAFLAWYEILQNKNKAAAHAEKLKKRKTDKRAQTTIKQWKKLVASKKALQKELNKKADIFAQKKPFRLWRAHKAVRDEELNRRLTACANSFDLYKQIKSLKRVCKTDDERALTQLELGASQVNLLLSGQRIVRFFAEQGYTDLSFQTSQKKRNLQTKKLLLDIHENLQQEYSFGTNTHMISQFFKNSARNRTQEDEEVSQLFDAVRGRDDKRMQQLLEPKLRNRAEDEDLKVFRRWLRKQREEKPEIPADAMVYGDGIRAMMCRIYLERKGYKSVEAFLDSVRSSNQAALETPNHPKAKVEDAHISALTAAASAQTGATGSAAAKPQPGAPGKPFRMPPSKPIFTLAPLPPKP